MCVNKREAFRRAYENFDLERVCAFDEEKMAKLQQDPGIIRNRLKIRASVNNAPDFSGDSAGVGEF